MFRDQATPPGAFGVWVWTSSFTARKASESNSVASSGSSVLTAEEDRPSVGLLQLGLVHSWIDLT